MTSFLGWETQDTLLILRENEAFSRHHGTYKTQNKAANY